ncbi:MAG: VWA domain-containing protein [Polyangiaceae bacterium]
MHFAQPGFLVLGFVLGVTLVALYVHLAFARRRALAQLGASHLLSHLTASVSHTKRRIKEAMTVVGVVLVAIALARPQYGSRWEEAHRRGVDLLFAVDTSKSMLTPDVKPNRLERAKLAVQDLVQKFPEDRVGLVAFAGSAFLETPLTLDHAIFDQSLGDLDTNVIPLGGTNVASAIDVAQKALADDEHKKILVLLTDGEDLSGDALEAAQSAVKQGLSIYTVGVGTAHGELIPLSSQNGQTEFVKDESGNFVTSKLDESLLEKIATTTGGSYRALGDNGQGLESLYRDDLALLPRSDLAARSQQVPIERYQWPLGLALLLLGLEPMIGERRRVRARVAKSLPPKSRHVWGRRFGVAATAALAAMLVLEPIASASPQSAEKEYRDQKFAQAQADYAAAAKSQPNDPRFQFNLGAANYRNGDFDSATKAFESALHTDDTNLQEHAYYNLGDVLYRTGEKTLKANKTDETIRTWKQAISDYEAGLRLDTKDADATFNRDFVQRKLAELEKKQDEQKRKDDQQKKQDQKKNDDSKSKDSKGGDSKNGDQKTPADPKQNPNSKNGQSPQAQNQNQPGQNPQAQRPEAPKPGETGEPEAPSKPGELSKSEARALLDSLRGDLQTKPSAIAPVTPAADQPQKDW